MSEKVSRPKTARREAMWLKAADEYFMTPAEIAAASGLSLRQVQRGLKRARGAKLDFLSQFDIEWVMNANPFTQEHQCRWHAYAEIPKGVRQGCLFCLRAGLSHLIRSGKPIAGSEAQKPKEEVPFAQRMHGIPSKPSKPGPSPESSTPSTSKPSRTPKKKSRGKS